MTHPQHRTPLSMNRIRNRAAGAARHG